MESNIVELKYRIIEYLQKSNQFVMSKIIPSEILQQIVEEEIKKNSTVDDFKELLSIINKRVNVEAEDINTFGENINILELFTPDVDKLDAYSLFIKDIANTPILTREEEAAFMKEIENGNLEYRNKFIEYNLKFVVFIAKRYLGSGMELLDLIQEGTMGLMKAIEKFDYRKGNKFSGYSYWWIRHYITRAISYKSRAIRLPVHVHENVIRVKVFIGEYERENGRKPTVEEIGKHMKMSPKAISELALERDVVSLQSLVSDDDESTLEQFVSSDGDSIERRYELKELINIMDKYFTAAKLSQREKEVLVYRFGLYDGEMHTLVEIGHMFDVTRERIRQIESRALEKLRKSSYNVKVIDYLDDQKSALERIREMNAYYYDRKKGYKSFDNIKERRKGK